LVSSIFKRNKKDKYLKALSILLYIFHGSFRKVSKELSILFEPISKSTIHKLVKKFLEIIKISIKPKKRKRIAIDETVIKLKGRKCFIWAAFDLENREIITMDVSLGRSELDAYLFLSKVKSKCKGKLPEIITDRGPWYNIVKSLGFSHSYSTFSLRNPVERLFRYLKERSKVFYNNINGSFKCIELFVKLFLFLYMMLKGG
jgi:transposase-like protein